MLDNFFSLINDYLKDLSKNKKLIDFVNKFNNSFEDLINVTEHIKSIDKVNLNEINGPAVEYLELISYVSIGFVWLQESYLWMHGLVFLFGAPYALMQDKHLLLFELGLLVLHLLIAMLLHKPVNF